MILERVICIMIYLVLLLLFLQGLHVTLVIGSESSTSWSVMRGCGRHYMAKSMRTPHSYTRMYLVEVSTYFWSSSVNAVTLLGYFTEGKREKIGLTVCVVSCESVFVRRVLQGHSAADE